MFDFLFKRSPSKPSEPHVIVSEKTIAQQAALRRAEQAGLALTLAGNEAGALEFILQSEFADVRLAAAQHIHSPAMLEQVHQAMRNTDRRVAKLMQGRLDVIRYEQAEQQRAQACIDIAQRLLADEKLSPNHVADLDRQWQVIAAPSGLAAQFMEVRASLGQRLAAQVALQRAVIDGLAELRKLPAAGLDQDAAAHAVVRLVAQHAEHGASAERGVLPKQLMNDFAAAVGQATMALAAQEQHQAAFDIRQATLAQWQAADPASLNAEHLRRDWQGLPGMPDNAAASALQQQFEALIATIPVSVKPKPAPAAHAPKEAGRHFVAALDAMEAALQQGLLQAASEHDKTLKDSGAGHLSPAQSERLAHVRAEFKRLADWARWGGNVSREELVKAVEELPAQRVPIGELAKKVGSLRERWKSLDTLSGAAPKTLWQRFDAACSLAYAPAAVHFKQLADERHANAAKAQALVAETAASAAGDAKSIAAAGQRLRQAWTRLGTIDRKEKKRLDGEFGKALDALLAPLEQQRKIEIEQREQLIAAVELLQPNERNIVDALHALQEKWQAHAKALPLERRAEQALWLRFRAACDAVFAQRKAAASVADHARRDHLHAKEAVCARLEGAVFADAGDDQGKRAAIAALLHSAKTDWNAIGPVPRASEAKIELRHQAAVALVQAQSAAIAQRAGAAQAHILRDKLRLCQAVENAVGQVDADPSEWSARWNALAPVAGQYEPALQQRFGAAETALAGAHAGYAALLESNRSKLLDEVLRLEMAAGIDSGAEFARARLALQVAVLQASLKSGQKASAPAAQFLQLCALPALADARTVSRIEQLLRRAGTAGMSVT